MMRIMAMRTKAAAMRQCRSKSRARRRLRLIQPMVRRLNASFDPREPLCVAVQPLAHGALFHADSVKPLFSDAALDTAHNEYLQYLVTNGALGLLSYLAAIVLALRTGIRRSVEQPVFRGIVIAVLAYAAQAVVNIAQPASTPLFFVLLGLLVSRPPELKPPDLAA